MRGIPLLDGHGLLANLDVDAAVRLDRDFLIEKVCAVIRYAIDVEISSMT